MALERGDWPSYEARQTPGPSPRLTTILTNITHTTITIVLVVAAAADTSAQGCAFLYCSTPFTTTHTASSPPYPLPALQRALLPRHLQLERLPRICGIPGGSRP